MEPEEMETLWWRLLEASGECGVRRVGPESAGFGKARMGEVHIRPRWGGTKA